MSRKRDLWVISMAAVLGWPGFAHANDPPELPPVNGYWGGGMVYGGGYQILCQGSGCADWLAMQDFGTFTFEPDPLPLESEGEGDEHTRPDGTTIDRAKKTVKTDAINCTAEFGTPENYASMYYLADPAAKVGTVITLIGAGGSSWKFVLTNKQHNPKVTRTTGGTCP